MPHSPETGGRTSERDRSPNGLPTSRREEGPNASSGRELTLSPATKPGPRRGKKPMEGERAIGLNNRLTRRTSNEEQSLEAGSSSGPDLMASTGNGRARGPWSRSSRRPGLPGGTTPQTSRSNVQEVSRRVPKKHRATGSDWAPIALRRDRLEPRHSTNLERGARLKAGVDAESRTKEPDRSGRLQSNRSGQAAGNRRQLPDQGSGGR